VWKALAAEQGGKGLYLAFADVICNDSQYLLDDVIRSLPEVLSRICSCCVCAAPAHVSDSRCTTGLSLHGHFNWTLPARLFKRASGLAAPAHTCMLAPRRRFGSWRSSWRTQPGGTRCRRRSERRSSSTSTPQASAFSVFLYGHATSGAAAWCGIVCAPHTTRVMLTRGCCALCAAAHNLQADIYLAGVYVRLLRRTTEDITHTWLLPEMVERIASMLTYFMDALVGRRLT
jgi:Ubiquitin elongating factor core